MKEVDEKYALILDPTDPTKFLYPDDNGDIYFKPNDAVLLSCSNTPGITFKYAPGPISKQFTCMCGSIFGTDRRVFNYKNLLCTSMPTHHVRDAGVVGSLMKYQIGFRTTDKDDFLNLIDVYYDSVLGRTAYTKSILSKHKPGGQKLRWKGYKRFNSTKHPFSDVDRYYNAANEVASFQMQLSTTSNDSNIVYVSGERKSMMYLNRGHMTPKASMIYKAAAKATYEHLNVLPQWVRINAGNWARIEGHVDVMARTLKKDLVTITGGHDQLQRLDNDGHPIALFLNALMKDKSVMHRLPIPKYTYKILIDPESNAGVTYVTVNDPYMKIEDAKSYYLCDEPYFCLAGVKPPKSWKPKNVMIGFSYFCKVSDFLKKTQISLLDTDAGSITKLLSIPGNCTDAPARENNHKVNRRELKPSVQD